MMDAYQQRVVAFIDVLGWSGACLQPARYSELRAATEGIAKHAGSFSLQTKDMLAKTVGGSAAAMARHASVEFSFFSDNFAVSAPLADAETVFRIVAWAANALLHKEFLIRGGVTVGDLHHAGDIIFGPALVEAVSLEKAANYPRVLCSEAMLAVLPATLRQDGILVCDHEGRWIMNIAVGSPLELAILQGVLERGEAVAPSGRSDKWAYLRSMLPRMYDVKGTRPQKY